MQQLLLIPLLAPLLAVLLVGAINPRPAVALRLLIWTSPALPLGGWMAGAGAAGAGLSALATVLALRQQGKTGEPPPQRTAQRRSAVPGATIDPPRRSQPQSPNSSGPSRAPGEPAPTVAVPFRVIRRGTPAQPRQSETAPAEPTMARAVGDGWDQPLSDSWD